MTREGQALSAFGLRMTREGQALSAFGLRMTRDEARR